MSIKKGQVLWLSQYALSGGIQQVAAKEDTKETYVFLDGLYYGFRLGKHLWLTHAEALIAAEAMRVKKLASLKRQIAKLEKLSFKEAP